MSGSVKERLTGAIILVALIVLLVPELLTGPVRPDSSSHTAAGSSEEAPLRSYTIDLADDSRPGVPSAATVEMAQPANAAQPPVAQPRVPGPASITEEGDAPTGAGPTSKAAAEGSPAAESKPAPPTSPASGASPAPSVSRKSDTPAPAHRDLPHPGAAAPDEPVEAAAAKRSNHAVAKAASEERTSSTAGPHAGSSGQWMVQLGVFASRSNADRLAQHLKEKGFPVSISESAVRGRKLFRVRAGPVPDRSAASELAAKLRAAGASGALVPRS